MNRTLRRLLGVLALVALLGAACGGDDGDDEAAATETTHSAASSDTAKADADLRAGLTALLQEHVYLAGVTTGVALSGGDFKPPAAALEQNTQALQEAVTSVYGEAGGARFGDLWRKHIGFFVDYTSGRAAGDEAKMKKAAADLDQYRADFGAFLESATEGRLKKEAVAEDLKTHVSSLVAAVDAQAAKSPDQYEKLRLAASHMPMTAATLAGAITAQFPDKFGA